MHLPYISLLKIPMISIFVSVLIEFFTYFLTRLTLESTYTRWDEDRVTRSACLIVHSQSAEGALRAQIKRVHLNTCRELSVLSVQSVFPLQSDKLNPSMKSTEIRHLRACPRASNRSPSLLSRVQRETPQNQRCGSVSCCFSTSFFISSSVWCCRSSNVVFFTICVPLFNSPALPSLLRLRSAEQSCNSQLSLPPPRSASRHRLPHPHFPQLSLPT